MGDSRNWTNNRRHYSPRGGRGGGGGIRGSPGGFRNGPQRNNFGGPGGGPVGYWRSRSPPEHMRRNSRLMMDNYPSPMMMDDPRRQMRQMDMRRQPPPLMQQARIQPPLRNQQQQQMHHAGPLPVNHHHAQPPPPPPPLLSGVPPLEPPPILDDSFAEFPLLDELRKSPSPTLDQNNSSNPATNMGSWAVQAGVGNATFLRSNAHTSPVLIPILSSPTLIKASPNNSGLSQPPLIAPKRSTPTHVAQSIPSLLSIAPQPQPPQTPQTLLAEQTTCTVKQGAKKNSVVENCNKTQIAVAGDTSDKNSCEVGVTPEVVNDKQNAAATVEFKVPTGKAPKVTRTFATLEEEAEALTKKVIESLSEMDIDRFKAMINNPEIQYESVLKSHATKRIRSKMQKKYGDYQLPTPAEENSIDNKKIPNEVFLEIDRVLDMNMFDNNSESDSDVVCLSDDKEDGDVLDHNLGLSSRDTPDRIINPEDIFLRAEILLMGDTSMLEPRSTSSTRFSSPIKEISDDESVVTKEPINFVSVDEASDEIPIFDIPLPESNPLPAETTEDIPLPPAGELQKHKPIKFKLAGFKKDEKKLSPIVLSVHNQKTTNTVQDDQVPKNSIVSGTPNVVIRDSTTPPTTVVSTTPPLRRSSSPSDVSPRRHKKKHRDRDRDGKVAIPRLHRDKTKSSKDETPKPRAIRPKSPDVVEVSTIVDKPKLDLKAKLMNLDAIKAGSIFSGQQKPKELSKTTDLLKNYRHVKNRGDSESPRSQSSSYTPPPNLTPPQGNTPPLLHEESESNSETYRERERDRERRKKKKKRREESTPEPRHEVVEFVEAVTPPLPSPPPQVVPVSTPSPLTPLEEESKQIIQISPKLNIEIKVLAPAASPTPELRTTDISGPPVNFQEDIEEITEVAVISRNSYPAETEESTTNFLTDQPEHQQQQQQQQHETSNHDDFYSVIDVPPVNKQQELDNIIDEVNSTTTTTTTPNEPAEATIETVAQGLLDEIVQMEMNGTGKHPQSFELIAQNLIDEVVKQQNDMHFSPPQSIPSAYQSPASFHSSPMHMHMHSPAPQLQPSPAHSVQSIHSMYSICSPASCYQYPPHLSPMQRTSPRQTLQMVDATTGMTLPYVVMEDGSTQLTADDTLNLSPEQVEQVASLHNTPIHTDKVAADSNFMDEIVRNLMQTTHQEPSTSPIEFQQCQREQVVEMLQGSASTSPKGDHYTSPIRNDVFLTQPTQQETEALHSLQSLHSQQAMDMEQFSPERLPDTFQEVQLEPKNFQYCENQQQQGHNAHESNNHRMWRSPGEKKCMEANVNATSAATASPHQQHLAADNNAEDNVGHVPLVSFGSNPQPSPRDDPPTHDGRMCPQMLTRLREIDLEMLKHQKEALCIGSMVQKLLAEKFRIEQETLKLQGERVVLMNQLLGTPMQLDSVPNADISDIIQRLALPVVAEKVLIDEKKRSDKKHSSTSTSSSQKKSRHRSRSRSRERKRSTSNSKHREKKREEKKKEEKPKECEKPQISTPSLQSTPVSVPSPQTPTLPAQKPPTEEIPRRSSPVKLVTPFQKPPIEVPAVPQPKITIALGTAQQVAASPKHVPAPKSVALLAKVTPAPHSQKKKPLFEEALTAAPKTSGVGKKMKDLKKAAATKAQPMYETISTSPNPHQEPVPPVVIRKSQLSSSPFVSEDLEIVETSNPPPKKRRRKAGEAENDIPSTVKRRRKNQTDTEVVKRKRGPKQTQVESDAPRKRGGGKIMQALMQSEVIELPDSPQIVNEPVIEDETSSTISTLPDEFFIPHESSPEPTPSVASTQHSAPVSHTSRTDNQVKPCLIVLKKIDMEKFMRNKAERPRLEPGLTISLPNSPEKDGELSPIGTPEVLKVTTKSPQNSEEDDFEGVPDELLWDGKYHGHTTAIVHLMVHQRYLIAASEGGEIYRYVWRTGKLEKVFREHTKAATCFALDDNEFIYSVSADGFMKKFHLENFTNSVESVHMGDHLHTIELCWNKAFIGTRNGRVLVYDTQTNKLMIPPLCEINKQVNVIKASMEGDKKVLFVGLRTNAIQIVDAENGQLLRQLTLGERFTIHSLALDHNLLHCGTNGNELITLDVMTGHEVSRKKCGSGAVSIKLYKNYIFTGCYDGVIYVFKTNEEKSITRLTGPAKMLHDFEIVNDKIIAGTKDKSLKIWDIGKDLLDQPKITTTDEVVVNAAMDVN